MPAVTKQQHSAFTRALLAAAIAVALVICCWSRPVHAQPQAPAEPTSAERAKQLWEAGYVRHVMGLYEPAIEAYRASIAIQPSAEAHTFLGWAYSHQGLIAEAIAECETAIRLDPDFGNPYNDIGVYLLELGEIEKAGPWFEKALAAKRYCCYQFAHANLARVQLAQGRIDAAKRSFERALDHDPEYLPALIGIELIRQVDPQRL